VCQLPVVAMDPVVEAWQAIVNDNLSHTEEGIRVRDTALRVGYNPFHCCRNVLCQHSLVCAAVITAVTVRLSVLLKVPHPLVGPDNMV
jgi:hypothetical protein